ncbi:MAG TPA: hypothetical protein VNO21_20660 [Polyangiaceae bacterium]|nr:hypothetical protein [Polyangiaceae bacterium]
MEAVECQDKLTVSLPKQTNRVVTTAAVLLSLFMASMETTVIATAMPTVVADLGGVELFGWVGAIYLLGSTPPLRLGQTEVSRS